MLRNLLSLIPLSALRIVGGDPVSPSDFKSHYSSIASLQFGGFHECGATLIAPDRALTAAHCIANYTQEMVQENETLLFGARDIAVSDSSGERIGIKAYRLHPGYDPETYHHDIALLILARPSKQKPALLEAGSAWPIDGTELFSAGWGDTEKGGSLSAELHAVKLKQVNLKACQDEFGESFPVFAENICAFQEAGDACHGDSGGPLYNFSEKGTKLVGIVSWGIGCANGFPGVYTRIGSYDFPSEAEKWPLGVGSNSW